MCLKEEIQLQYVTANVNWPVYEAPKPIEIDITDVWRNINTRENLNNYMHKLFFPDGKLWSFLLIKCIERATKTWNSKVPGFNYHIIMIESLTLFCMYCIADGISIEHVDYFLGKYLANGAIDVTYKRYKTSPLIQMCAIKGNGTRNHW